MLEVKFVRDNLKLVQESLHKRGQDYALDGFLDCDSKRRSILLEVEQLKHQRNRVSEQIAKMKKAKEDATELITQMGAVSQKIKVLDEELSRHEQTLRSVLMELPNLPHSSVPVGQNSEDNIVLREEGIPPAFDFEPLEHWEIGGRLGILDRACLEQLYAGRPDQGARVFGGTSPLYDQPHQHNCYRPAAQV
jgi:seryl-tRNA synthetase